MSKIDGPPDNSDSETPRQRTITVYDRLEEARARREQALLGKPEAEKAAAAVAAKPRKREKGDGMAAVVTSIKRSAKNAEAAAKATYAAAPEPTEPKRKRRVAALVAIPALIGLAAVALPIATGDQDRASSETAALELPEEGLAEDSVVARATPSNDPTFSSEANTVETASLGQGTVILDETTANGDSTELETAATDSANSNTSAPSATSVPADASTTALADSAAPEGTTFAPEAENTETASLATGGKTGGDMTTTTASLADDDATDPESAQITDSAVAIAEDKTFEAAGENLQTAALSDQDSETSVTFLELRADTLTTDAPLAPSLDLQNIASAGLDLPQQPSTSAPTLVAALDPILTKVALPSDADIGKPPLVSDIPALGPKVFKTSLATLNGKGFDTNETVSVASSSASDAAPKRAETLALAEANGPTNSPNVQGLAQQPSNVLLLSDLNFPRFEAPFELDSIKVAALGPLEYAIEALTGPSKPRAASADRVIEAPAPPARDYSLFLGGLEDDDIRLVLQIPDKVGDSRVAEYKDAAEAAGLTVDRVIRTSFTISGTNVRYYHERDAEAAKFIADTMGARARDFTSFRPTPKLGLIEIYAEGKSTPRPRVVQPRVPTQVARQAEPKRYRIIRITKPRRGFNPFRNNNDDDDSANRVVEVVTVTQRPTQGTNLSDLFDSAGNGAGTSGGTASGSTNGAATTGGTTTGGTTTGGTTTGGSTTGTGTTGGTTTSGTTTGGSTTGTGTTGGTTTGGTSTGGSTTGTGTTGGTTTGGTTTGGSTTGTGTTGGTTTGGTTTGGSTTGTGTTGGTTTGGTTTGGSTTGTGSTGGTTTGGTTTSGGTAGGNTTSGGNAASGGNTTSGGNAASGGNANAGGATSGNSVGGGS